MPRIATYLFLYLLFPLCAIGQSNPNYMRNSSEVQTQRSASRVSSSLNFRIENGKCWINGNLVTDKQLPESLRAIDPSIFYQTSVFGMDEIGFSLNGKDFVVKSDRIIELPSVAQTNSMSSERGQVRQEASQAYYSQLKRESPGLFQSINREGMLYEEIRNLLLKFQRAKGKEKNQIKDELRTVLGQLFDLNERNREMEIRELEEMIESAKKEVLFRKSNKSNIVDSALRDLIGE